MYNTAKYNMFMEAVSQGLFIYKDGRVYRTKKFSNRTKKYEDLPVSEVASHTTKTGYHRLVYNKTTIYEHTLVYCIFYGVGCLNRLQCIDHVNGIKDDNRIENLEGTTTKENTRRAEKMGNYKRT